MRHSFIRSVAACFGFVLLASNIARAATPWDQVLPASTQGFVSVPNLAALLASFRRTDFGRLLDDPRMRPFRDDIRRQIEAQWLAAHPALALTGPDLENLATGELALALVAVPEGKAGLVLLVEVTGREAQAHATLEKFAAGIAQRGGRRSVQKHPAATLTVLTSAPKQAGGEPLETAYFMRGGLLVVSDRPAVAAQLAARLARDPATAPRDSLADAPAYKAVIERAAVAAASQPPHARWFIAPIGLAEALATWQPPPKGRTDYLPILKRQGFGAIQGVGGHVNFAAGPYGLLHRTAVFAPPPYEKAMRMLSFPNTRADVYAPQPWVAGNVTTYTSFQCDFLNAFDHFGTLFDEFVDEGAWDRLLNDLKSNANGNYDVRKDLVAHLGHRATLLTDYTLPITPQSQRRLLAIELKNPAQFAEQLERSLDGDPQFNRLSVGNYTIWEIVPQEEDELPPIEINIGGVGNAPAPAPAVKLPNAAIAAVEGHLFVTTHLDLLQQVLADARPPRPLADDADYQRVLVELGKLGADQLCALGFSRADEQIRATYELFRAGKMPEAETLLGRLLNAVLGDGKEGSVREAKLNGSKLPEFSVVADYLGPGGSMVASEPTGWFVVGFTLDSSPGQEQPTATKPGAKKR